jgi:hypothetical protein
MGNTKLKNQSMICSVLGKQIMYWLSFSSDAAEDWNSSRHAEVWSHHHYSGDLLPHLVRHVLHIGLQLRAETNSWSPDHTGQYPTNFLAWGYQFMIPVSYTSKCHGRFAWVRKLIHGHMIIRPTVSRLCPWENEFTIIESYRSIPHSCFSLRKN